MACSKEERLEVSDGSLCGICSEKFTIPRRIETCGHTFCEQCLFTFVFDLKEKGKLNASFDCPFCGTPHPLQETGEVTLEWIQTFPLAIDIIESDKGSCDILGVDDEEEARSCGPCAKDGDDIPGKQYCLECQTYLCDTCVRYHRKFEALSGHKLIERLPEILTCDNLSVLHKYRKCRKHPNRDVELFCKDDDIFICLLCVSTSHKNCRNVVEVSECTNEGTEKIDDLKTKIEASQKHLGLLQRLMTQNSSSIQTQTESFVRELNDAKDEVISSLETTVENTCARAKQLSQEVEDKDKANIEIIDGLKDVYNKKLTFIDAVHQYGSTPEIVMSSTELDTELEQLEEQVCAIDETFVTADIDCSMIEKFQELSQQLEPSKQQNVLIVKKTSDHPPYRTTLACTPSPFVVRTTELHTLKIVQGTTPTFSGISVKDDGHLILCDEYESNLCVYNPVDKKKWLLTINQAYAAAQLNAQAVAVTMKSDKQISIVSSDLGLELKQERSLATKYQPRGIVAMRTGNVAISWTDPPGFSFADISGTTIQESQYLAQDNDGRQFKSFDFLAIDEARKLVIQPCSKDKAVYGFSFTGKPVFKYTNNMSSPNGVAVDSRNGSVFVCDNLGHGVHQLTVEGKPIAVIQHTELRSPLNVCYNKQLKCLWVTQDSSPRYEVVSCFKQG